MIDTSVLWNKNKKGTAIISHYRCGTHFLHDVILNIVPGAQNRLQEINTIEEFSTVEKSDRYQIAILNRSSVKLRLIGQKEILDDWHVIRLTRQDISFFESLVLDCATYC